MKAGSGSAQVGNKPRILVVDDEEANRELLEAKLTPLGYEVLLARNGGEALEKAQRASPDLILLDVMMPGMNGFEVAARLKKDERGKLIPIVMVTSLSEVSDRVKALEAGADDFLTKPVDDTELRARLQSLLKVKAYNDYMVDHQEFLEGEVAKRTEELREAFGKLKAASLESINRLARAAEYRDEDTGEHIQRMSRYSAAVARAAGLDGATAEAILYAAPMHDVGKIGIPDRILLKPAKLDRDEWAIMKRHSKIGAGILEGSDAEFVKLAEVIALSHHEKWDGGGYPRALKGKDIPLAGRITAIADVFDALTSKRPYKEPFPIDKSFSIMRDGQGSHFDPDLIDAFFSIEEETLAIKDKYRDRAESKFLKMRTEGDLVDERR